MPMPPAQSHICFDIFHQDLRDLLLRVLEVAPPD
jgi:hypothetical protein